MRSLHEVQKIDELETCRVSLPFHVFHPPYHSRLPQSVMLWVCTLSYRTDFA
jgi:hypothetical protein